MDEEEANWVAQVTESIDRLLQPEGYYRRPPPTEWAPRDDARNARLRRTCRSLMYGEEIARAAGDHDLAAKRRREFEATIRLTWYVRPTPEQMRDNLMAFAVHAMRIQGPVSEVPPPRPRDERGRYAD